ncbi:MAG: hypothetical protein NXI01_05035 [Gammaproteobacteria bacterium]|nr:hypothetical protein [Gammaproteobacteria bacterium]
MPAAEIALEQMHTHLNALEIPKDESVSQAQIQQFEFQLKTIFFETLSAIGHDELDALRRAHSPIFLNVSFSHAGAFTRNLSLAPSETIRQLPDCLFQDCLNKTSELSMSKFFQN